MFNLRVIFIAAFLPLLFVVSAFGEIIKSPLDNRTYRSFELDNKLKVIVVSDPQVEKAAAAINIQVGSYDDPPDVLGMTHFLEHMLFLGTEKYPEPNEYSKFISENGGYSNAYTKSTETLFFHAIDHNRLEPSLDRLAQFFIAPLFTREFTNRELNAVNAEHSKNNQSDFRRMYTVLKENALPEHPFSKFSAGNRDTLAIHSDLNNRLEQYFAENYSADRMSLAVVGVESLDQLEAYVRKYFSGIKNKNLGRKPFEGDVFDPNKLPLMIQIKPLKTTRTLILSFSGEGNKEGYRNKSANLISGILGDESKNSLFQFLKNKNLVNSLSVSGREYTDDSKTEFSVYIDLTEEGEQQYNQVIAYFFEYVEQLKRKTPEAWRYDEVKKVSDQMFRFSYQPLEPVALVNQLAQYRQAYPNDDVLYADYRYDGYDIDNIRRLINIISPEKMVAVLMAPSAKTNKTEKWHGAEYSAATVSAQQVNSWKFSSKLAKSGFSLPERNPFIADTIEILKKDGGSQLPDKIYDGEGLSFSFLQDGQFKQSQAVFKLDLALPDSLSSVRNTSLTKLYVKLLGDRLNSQIYQAFTAGFDISVDPTVSGLSITVSGYYEKIPELLNLLIKEMFLETVPQDRFAVLKKEMVEEYQNDALGQSNALGFANYKFLNYRYGWFYDQYVNALPALTAGDLVDYGKNLFNAMHIDAVLYGNADRKTADELLAIIQKKLTYTPVDFSKVPNRENLKFAAGVDYIVPIKAQDKDNAVIQIFQSENKTFRDIMLNELLMLSFSNEAFTQLRTNEQLGYIVGAFNASANYSPISAILVQSPEATPEFISQRIAAFLQQYGAQLQTMTDEDFAAQVNVLKNKYSEEPKTFNKFADKLFFSLREHDDKMESNALTIKTLEGLERQDLIDYYQRVFLDKDNREMTLHVYGKSFDMPETKNTDEKSVVIDDIYRFRSTAEYYPTKYFSDFSEK